VIARPGGFLFYVGRTFVVASKKAGKMPALQVAKNYQKNGTFLLIGGLFDDATLCFSIRCRILEDPK
jgi:hypothetical protein